MRSSLAIVTAAALAMTLVSVAHTVAEESGADVIDRATIANASFEEAAENLPVGWSTHTWSGKALFSYAQSGRTGNRSVMISSDAGADAGWFALVPVKPFSTYRLSGWIKTEDVKPSGGRGALLNLHGIDRTGTWAVRGTRDWMPVEIVFETGARDQVQVNCLLGGWGKCTGRAWYDDLKLECLASASIEPAVSINASETREPVSKYIYGQFIEHLGRCIYGGIWAEMLEDRKFYYAVADEASPWEALDNDSVEMVQNDSFVGQHTPLIAAGGGIRQRGLGLVEGKTYVGYIWLKAQDRPATVEVSLVWGLGKTAAALETVRLRTEPGEYEKFRLEIRAGATTDDGTLAVKVAKSDGGGCYLGTLSLMPEDNVHGMRPDTLELLRELDSPIYRWPGGNFVSGYDWRDGICDRDRRPPRKNPAWKGVEHNDFGIDDFMIFCDLIDTEPLVVVNTGQGGVDMAVAELEYANGKASTPMGRVRSQNGHVEPYRVKWWGVGNEMYGGWQLGHMPLEDYIKKHNQFADAMRAADPSVKLVAVGATGPWSEGMMAHSADHMDLVSEHFYCHEKPSLIGHVAQMPARVKDKADAHRRYRKEIDSLAGKDVRIALDEWNYWYGEYVYGELGTRYFLKDALGVAAALNEYVRQSDIFFMANYAQTVNVIGCIKTTKTAASFATTGLVLKLYRHRFGVLPVAVEYNPPFDTSAALSADGKTLTVAIVNPTMKQVDIPLKVEGVELTGAGTLWQIAGSDPMAYNTPGEKPKVVIEEMPLSGVSDKLPVAACSVSLYELTVK